MRITRIVLLVLGLGHSCTILANSVQTFINQSIEDYHYYYQDNLLFSTGILFSASGLSANTPLDAQITHYWQSHRSTVLNNTLNPFNSLGGTKMMLPVYFLLSFSSTLYTNQSTQAIALWGNHASRIILLGGPQQAVLTHFLGSQRPEQGDSHWHILQGNRAVSGHAFYGAIPFLALIQSNTPPLLQYTFYTLSTLPALARLNQNKHYFSQILAGWGLAYFSNKAIQQTSEDRIRYDLIPEKHSLLFSARLKF